MSKKIKTVSQQTTFTVQTADQRRAAKRKRSKAARARLRLPTGQFTTVDDLTDFVNTMLRYNK
jgi:hypothetical protein